MEKEIAVVGRRQVIESTDVRVETLTCSVTSEQNTILPGSLLQQLDGLVVWVLALQ